MHTTNSMHMLWILYYAYLLLVLASMHKNARVNIKMYYLASGETVARPAAQSSDPKAGNSSSYSRPNTLLGQ